MAKKVAKKKVPAQSAKKAAKKTTAKKAAKSAAKKTTKVKASKKASPKKPAAKKPVQESLTFAPSHDEIATEALAIYNKRLAEGQHGCANSDWFAAIDKLKAN